MIALTLPTRRMSDRSPEDKNVNFPCTTAAFTLPLEPSGFVMSCPLTRRLSLGYPLAVMRFLSVGSHVSPSGFLRTNPHGYALAFGSYFW